MKELKIGTKRKKEEKKSSFETIHAHRRKVIFSQFRKIKNWDRNTFYIFIGFILGRNVG